MRPFQQDKPALYRRRIWARFCGSPDRVVIQTWRMHMANLAPEEITETLPAYTCTINADGDYEFSRVVGERAA